MLLREFRDLLQVFRRRHGPQRIGGAVDEDRPGLRRQAFLQVCRLYVEMIFLVDRHIHDIHLRHVRHADIGGVVRAGDEDILPRVEHAQHRHQQGVGSADEHVHVGGVAVQPVQRPGPLCDGFPQGGNAGIGHIFRVTVVQGPGGLIDHVLTRPEPGFADAEIDGIFVLRRCFEHGADAGKRILFRTFTQFHSSITSINNRAFSTRGWREGRPAAPRLRRQNWLLPFFCGPACPSCRPAPG